MCGCQVIVPRAQACCGAIDHHGGAPEAARRLARRNIQALADVEQVVICIAGCGAMLKQYAHLLRDDPDWAEPARRFAEKVRDIHEVLHEYDPDPPRREVRAVATYHDACHLAHAQHVTAAPRALLRSVPGLVLRALHESDMCCGAAGTYNLDEPAMSRDLAARKLRNIAAAGADMCITANIGCAMQIESEARRLGIKLDVRHPVDLLHEAYFGDGQPADRPDAP
jgi:glycolate oxidase iron-sulfur subunit